LGFLRDLREQIRHQEIALTGLVLAIVPLLVPLQHYMPLARFQHRAISLAVVACGFLLQTIIGWRYISRWGRTALVLSTCFITSVATYLWVNPWLSNPDLATERQLLERQFFSGFMLFLLASVTCTWFQWSIQRHRAIDAAEKERTRG
jgi:hypothetical protein